MTKSHDYSRSPKNQHDDAYKEGERRKRRSRSRSCKERSRKRKHCDKVEHRRSSGETRRRSADRSGSPGTSKSDRDRAPFDRRDQRQGRSGPEQGRRKPREWDGGKEPGWRDPGGSSRKFEWGKAAKAEDLASKNGSEQQSKPKEKPNFETTGKLAQDTNKYQGVVIKYNEPPEACKPKVRWRLYPFKNDASLPTLYVHRQSAYLIGKDRRVVDLPVDHPSCSKQHAVLQYRQVGVKTPDGRTVRRIKPYVIDLESANGTFLNNKQIEAKKYYELFEKDVLKFGFSTREYVLLHEHSLEAEGEAEPESSPNEAGSESEADDGGVKEKGRLPLVKVEPLSDREDN